MVNLRRTLGKRFALDATMLTLSAGLPPQALPEKVEELWLQGLLGDAHLRVSLHRPAHRHGAHGATATAFGCWESKATHAAAADMPTRASTPLRALESRSLALAELKPPQPSHGSNHCVTHRDCVFRRSARMLRPVATKTSKNAQTTFCPRPSKNELVFPY
eukprot:6188457-Pleurochrysis_carterae.AAC.2